MFATAFLALMLAASPGASIHDHRVQARDVDANYVRVVAADGTVTLAGHDKRTNRPFQFKVKEGRVRGWVGSEYIAFPVSEALPSRP